MSLTLDELNEKAKKRRADTITLLKANYKLSRRLGFTSAESSILQSHKKGNIIALAIERGFIKDDTDTKIEG